MSGTLSLSLGRTLRIQTSTMTQETLSAHCLTTKRTCQGRSKVDLLHGHLLHALLLLNEECAKHTLSDSLATSGSTIGPADSLLALVKALVSMTLDCRHAPQLLAGVTALGSLHLLLANVVDKLAT
eukprot:6406487-Amphidinium_carterae.1